MSKISQKTTLERRIEESPELVKKFLQHLNIIENKSELTVKSYYYNIKYLMLYLIEKETGMKAKTVDEEILLLNKYVNREFIEEITQENILDYLYHTQKENNSVATTRKNMLSAYKSFYRYLCTYQGIQNNPTIQIPSPKKAKTLPKYLTLEQAEHLIDVVAEDEKDEYKRNLCMVIMLINCGLRVSELVGLNISDISLSEYTLKVKGKGNKERTIYLNEACEKILVEYQSNRLEMKHIKDKSALFISPQTGMRVSVRRVQQIIKGYFKNAGYENEGFSTHKLRHTSATLMYQYGNVDIRAIQAILGHQSLATTQIYTHLNDKQLHKAVNSNPLATYEGRNNKNSKVS